MGKKKMVLKGLALLSCLFMFTASTSLAQDTCESNYDYNYDVNIRTMLAAAGFENDDWTQIEPSADCDAFCKETFPLPWISYELTCRIICAQCDAQGVEPCIAGSDFLGQPIISCECGGDCCLLGKKCCRMESGDFCCDLFDVCCENGGCAPFLTECCGVSYCPFLSSCCMGETYGLCCDFPQQKCCKGETSVACCGLINECCEGKCCTPLEECCEGDCCSLGETCCGVDEDTKMCCPSDQCIDNECCPTGRSFLADDGSTICCPEGEQPCGSKCCSSGEQCNEVINPNGEIQYECCPTGESPCGPSNVPGPGEGFIYSCCTSDNRCCSTSEIYDTWHCYTEAEGSISCCPTIGACDNDTSCCQAPDAGGLIRTKCCNANERCCWEDKPSLTPIGPHCCDPEFTDCDSILTCD